MPAIRAIERLLPAERHRYPRRPPRQSAPTSAIQRRQPQRPPRNVGHSGHARCHWRALIEDMVRSRWVYRKPCMITSPDTEDGIACRSGPMAWRSALEGPETSSLRLARWCQPTWRSSHASSRISPVTTARDTRGGARIDMSRILPRMPTAPPTIKSARSGT